jgi:hypothetical protein
MDGCGQQLLGVRRAAADAFEEDHGGVTFVPLIGAQGWRESAPELPTEHAPARSQPKRRPKEPGDPVPLIASAAEALPGACRSGVRRFADRFGDARVVLIGEATHGTSEFHRARAELTKRLIAAHRRTLIQ